MTEEIAITCILSEKEMTRILRDYMQLNAKTQVPEDAEVTLTPHGDGWEGVVEFAEPHPVLGSYLHQARIRPAAGSSS